jgi:hypothetical protein
MKQFFENNKGFFSSPSMFRSPSTCLSFPRRMCWTHPVQSIAPALALTFGIAIVVALTFDPRSAHTPPDSVGAAHYIGFLAGKARGDLGLCPRNLSAFPGALFPAPAPTPSGVTLDGLPLAVGPRSPRHLHVPRAAAPTGPNMAVVNGILLVLVLLIAIALSRRYLSVGRPLSDQAAHWPTLSSYVPASPSPVPSIFAEDLQECLRDDLVAALHDARYVLGALARQPDPDAPTTFSPTEQRGLARIGVFTTSDFARAVLAIADQAANLAHYLEIDGSRLLHLYRRCCLLNDLALHWEGLPCLPPPPPARPAPFDSDWLPSRVDVLSHLPELRDELRRVLVHDLPRHDVSDPSSLAQCFGLHPRAVVLALTLCIGSSSALVAVIERSFTGGEQWRLAAALDLTLSQLVEGYVAACRLLGQSVGLRLPEPPATQVGREEVRIRLADQLLYITADVEAASRRYRSTRPLVHLAPSATAWLYDQGVENLEAFWVLVAFSLDHGLLDDLAYALSTSVQTIFTVFLRAGWGRRVALQAGIGAHPATPSTEARMPATHNIGLSVLTIVLLVLGLPVAGAQETPFAWPNATRFNLSSTTAVPPTPAGWPSPLTVPWTWWMWALVGASLWVAVQVVMALWRLPVVQETRAVQLLRFTLFRPLWCMWHFTVVAVRFVLAALWPVPRAAVLPVPVLDEPESPFVRRGRLDFTSPPRSAAVPAAMGPPPPLATATPARHASVAWSGLSLSEQQQWQGGHVPVLS